MIHVKSVKFVVLCCLMLTQCCLNLAGDSSFEDNDFAEFEDFDSDDDLMKIQESNAGAQLSATEEVSSFTEKGVKRDQNILEDDDDDGIVEDEDEFFKDEEEFEGFDSPDKEDDDLDQRMTEPKLTVAKIPMHFRTHWDSYWIEMLMLAGLMVYFINFFVGKAKNANLANRWFNTHRALLDDNFVLVGDDGKMDNEKNGLIKESESLYTLGCSGRTCCEGMLVELKMIKRQDVVSLTAGLMRAQQDQVHIKIDLTRGIMDTFVFFVGTKRTVTKVFKEYSDLSKYCTQVSKPVTRYNVPDGLSILSEIPEATSAILENRVIIALTKYQQYIDYIHISDQFSGPVQQEDANTLKQPDTKPILWAGFNLPKDGDMEAVKPLLSLIFYLMERLKTYRISKEGKQKADRNRLRVEEDFLKSTHAARAEAAAQRREEKRKQEKERVMAEDDPEKQRRWELKEQKRQAKKKAPKMKRLAVKSL